MRKKLIRQSDDDPYMATRESKAKYRREIQRRKEKRDKFDNMIHTGLRRLREQTHHRPDFFDQGFLDQVYKYALLGCNDVEISRLFEITAETFYRWIREKPGVKDALEVGRDIADASVARAFYSRCVGYSYQAVKIFFDKDTGEVIQVPYSEHVPPDPTAAARWLANRRKNKPDGDIWADSHKVEISGANGQALVQPIIVINPVSPLPQIDSDDQRLIDGKPE